MNIRELEHSLVRKYHGEPDDEITHKHIIEDVKSVYPTVERVEIVNSPYYGSITLSLTFKTPADETWFKLKWT